MSSQSSLPTKIISLGRRWRVPPPLTRNQEVKLISLAHLWPLMHPAENSNIVKWVYIGVMLWSIKRCSYSANRREWGKLLHTITVSKLLQHLYQCHMCDIYFRYHPRTLTCSSPTVVQLTTWKKNYKCKKNKNKNWLSSLQNSRHPPKLPNWIILCRVTRSPNPVPHHWGKKRRGQIQIYKEKDDYETWHPERQR